MLDWRSSFFCRSQTHANALTLNWASLNAYAFLPFHLIKNFPFRLRPEITQIVLICLHWQEQPWFPLLLEMVTAIPFNLHQRESTSSSGSRWPPTHSDRDELNYCNRLETVRGDRQRPFAKCGQFAVCGNPSHYTYCWPVCLGHLAAISVRNGVLISCRMTKKISWNLWLTCSLR